MIKYLLPIAVTLMSPSTSFSFPSLNKLPSTFDVQWASDSGCVDLTGSWFGECREESDDGVVNVVKGSLDLLQNDCDSITSDNETYPIGGSRTVATTATKYTTTLVGTADWNSDRSELTVNYSISSRNLSSDDRYFYFQTGGSLTLKREEEKLVSTYENFSMTKIQGETAGSKINVKGICTYTKKTTTP